MLCNHNSDSLVNLAAGARVRRKYLDKTKLSPTVPYNNGLRICLENLCYVLRSQFVKGSYLSVTFREIPCVEMSEFLGYYSAEDLELFGRLGDSPPAALDYLELDCSTVEEDNPEIPASFHHMLEQLLQASQFSLKHMEIYGTSFGICNFFQPEKVE